MKIRFLVYFITMAICLGSFYFLFLIFQDNDCDKLEALVSDSGNNMKIRMGFEQLLRNPSRFSKAVSASKQPYGVLLIDELNDELGFDWGVMGIDKKYASVEIRGEGLDYQNFSPILVTSVSVGIGYRKQAVFKVEDNYKVEKDFFLECQK
jgi:hypothetical protein